MTIPTTTPTAEERSVWANNAVKRIRAFNMFESAGWVVWSDPVNKVYTDRDRTTFIGNMDDVVSAMSGLGWFGDDGWDSGLDESSIHAIRYVLDLHDVLSYNEAGAMFAMGVTAEKARMMASNGVDSDLLGSVISGS